jgi:hypothetical protein
LLSKQWIFENVFKFSDDAINVINNDIVNDVKQTYRTTKIKEEGIDPAKTFNKLSVDGSPGGPPGDGPGTPPPGNLSDLEKAAQKPGAPEPDAPPTPTNAPLKERDQTGRKDASKYPFGEDALGNMENNRKSNKTTDPMKHNFRKNSPLSFEALDVFLNRVEAKTETLLSEENKKLATTKHILSDNIITEE